MPEYNFQLRGRHVLIGIVFLVGVFGAKLLLKIRTVDDGMRQAITHHPRITNHR